MPAEPATMQIRAMLAAALAGLAWPVAIVALAFLYRLGVAALTDSLVKRRG